MMRFEVKVMLRKRQMTRGLKLTWLVSGIAIVACLIAGWVWLSPVVGKVTTMTFAGAVLMNDPDPQKQVPIPGALVKATLGKTVVRGSSDETGYFQLVLPRQLPNEALMITVTHPSYFPLEQPRADPARLFIAKLLPTPETKPAANNGPQLSITNVRIRYTTKEEATVNIGNIVKAFPVPNVPNLPCNASPNCSPDGKWKATSTTVSYDAGEHNQFINIRASCVAGPCAFSQVESSNISGAVREMKITVKNWSDPTTYLVEAEVSRTMSSDRVREAFPAIFGTSMDFSLPALAEGPSIEADLNGTSIVFPLGPNLLLSWATCTAGQSSGHERLFRCELKPGFVFR